MANEALKNTYLGWLSYGCFYIGVCPFGINQIIEHNLTPLHAALPKMYLEKWQHEHEHKLNSLDLL